MNIKAFIKKILGSFPLKNIIIFESNPDYADNTYWFFKYLVEKKEIQKKYKLVWFVKKSDDKKEELCGASIVCVCEVPASFFEKLKKIYYQSRAKYIIDCNTFVHKYSNRQKRVYLTHGMTLKTADRYLADNYDSDLTCITSTFFAPYFDSFVTDKNRNSVCVTGTPRNDELFTDIRLFDDNKKRIIWMPTYRQHKTASDMQMDNIFPFGIPVIKNKDDIEKLDRVLEKNNIELLFRPHPAQDLSRLNLESGTNIKIADDTYIAEHKTNLYELMASTDALITDYSSVYYDYMLLDKPIALTLEDIDSFSKVWPLYIDKNDPHFVGVRINTTNELISFAKDIAAGKDILKTQREDANDIFNTVREPKACENIYNYMHKSWNF